MILFPPAIVRIVKSACEKYLIAEDPWQFRDMNTDRLVRSWLSHVQHNLDLKVIEMEILYRINHTSMTRDDREILSKTLENR